MVLTLTLLLACAPPAPRELWVYAPARHQREALSRARVGFAEAEDGGWLRVQTDAAGAAALRRGGWRVRPAAPPPPLDDAYHDPEEVEAALEALEAAWPDRAERVRVGWSREGRALTALRLGEEGAPAWRVLATHHGDEPSSTELALELAAALLAGEGPCAGLLDLGAVWVLPVVNPDGLAAGTRQNAAGVDLNRNYSYAWSAAAYGAGPEPFSEPETRAVRDLSLREAFFAGMSLHAGAQNVGWPFNYTPADSVEDGAMAALAGTYAAACGLEGFEALNGADWFITQGDTNDWSYGVQGTMDLTVELSRDKAPPADALPALAAAHLPALAAALGQPVALEGRVVDAQTGRPVPAVLELPGLSAPFGNHPVSGRFARLLVAGEGRLRVRAPGYAPAEVDPADAAEIRLTPARLEGVRVSPALVEAAEGPVWVRLEGRPAPPLGLWLVREGLDPWELPRRGDAFYLDPAQIAPGTWTVDLGAQGALPRALHIQGAGDLQVHAVEEAGGQLTVLGAGFAPGARAYGLWGPDRAWEPLAVLGQTEQVLVLDAAPLESARGAGALDAGTATLVVVSAGEERAWPLAAPADDTASLADPDTGTPGAEVVRSTSDNRGCQPVPSPPGALGLVASLLAWSRRWPASCPSCSPLPRSGA